jgi:Predicted transcriptional regulator with C-terminal CBS domains
VGLPAGTRRRTAGLRREEVAQLAGVSTTYYTFLEQGRDVRPSRQVVTALASALRLSSAERRTCSSWPGSAWRPRTRRRPRRWPPWSARWSAGSTPSRRT